MPMISQTPRILPVFILADASGSMTENGKIGALNRGVREMLSSFAQPHHAGVISVAVISFGADSANLHTPFTLAKDVQWKDIPATGSTPMGAAFTLLASLIEDRNVIAGRDYRPMVVLASDGRPTDDWEGPLEALNKGARAGKADRFALAIGPDADPAVLQRFAAAARAAGASAGVFRAGDEHQIRDFFKYSTMSAELRGTSSDPNASTSADPGDLDAIN